MSMRSWKIPHSVRHLTLGETYNHILKGVQLGKALRWRCVGSCWVSLGMIDPQLGQFRKLFLVAKRS